MKIKSGTYTFKSTPYIYSNSQSATHFEDEANPPFSIIFDGEQLSLIILAFQVYDTEEINIEGIYPRIYFLDTNGNEYDLYDYNYWADEYNREITVLRDIDVHKVFYEMFTRSTNYNEINPPEHSTIEYNGQVIASLNAGDKATIHCSQFNMSKDLVIKINA